MKLNLWFWCNLFIDSSTTFIFPPQNLNRKIGLSSAKEEYPKNSLSVQSETVFRIRWANESSNLDTWLYAKITLWKRKCQEKEIVSTFTGKNNSTRLSELYNVSESRNVKSWMRFHHLKRVFSIYLIQSLFSMSTSLQCLFGWPASVHFEIYHCSLHFVMNHNFFVVELWFRCRYSFEILFWGEKKRHFRWRTLI